MTKKLANKYGPTVRVRTKIEDRDHDEHDNERIIPVGTCGTIQDRATYEPESWTILWDNGGVTIWDAVELDVDAELLTRRCPRCQRQTTGVVVDIPARAGRRYAGYLMHTEGTRATCMLTRLQIEEFNKK